MTIEENKRLSIAQLEYERLRQANHLAMQLFSLMRDDETLDITIKKSNIVSINKQNQYGILLITKPNVIIEMKPKENG